MEKFKRSLEDLKSEIVENDESFSCLYRIEAIIGHGAFGTVLSCTELKTDTHYAVKIILKKSFNANDLNKLRYEAETLSLLSHPNIVKYKHCVETESKMFVIMELIRGGSLKRFMDERKKADANITDIEAATIMKSILQGVSYMHKNNIVHRDLKPENILIDDTKDLSTIKLTDFGLSVQFGREFISRQLTQSCGTLIFMAPELAFHHPYSMTVDIWSCGIILYLLLSGDKHPLYTPDDSHEAFREKLANPKWTFPASFSKYAIDLFERLTKQDPSERYRAEEALKHPWITRKKNMIPQTISEQRKTFYNQITFVNIISATMVISHILKKLNDLPKIPLTYAFLVEKMNREIEKNRQEQKSLSELSPHSPNHENQVHYEEEKEQQKLLNVTKVENEQSFTARAGFSEVLEKHPVSGFAKKGSHIKHDSFNENSRKGSISKKELTLKIDSKSPEVRVQTSKTFYSPQKKIEYSPKKLSTPSREKEKMGETRKTSGIRLEKVPIGPNNVSKSEISPRKKY